MSWQSFLKSDLFNLFIGAVAGAIIQFFLAIFFEDNFRNLYRRASRIVRWVISRFKNSFDPKAIENFHIGKYSTPNVVLEGYGSYRRAYYETHRITTTLDQEDLQLPEPLLKNLKLVEEEQLLIKNESGNPRYHNGPMVALDRYSVARTPIFEDPCLTLNFIKTDYYTFLATSLKMSSVVEDENQGFDTLKHKYLSGRSLTDPCKFIATSFGVNLCVITSDNYTLIGRRSDIVSNYRRRFQVGVCESVIPTLDFDPETNPIDLYRTAIRGAQEELGIEIQKKNVRFFSLCVDVDYYLYGLTGMIETDRTLAQLQSRRSIGIKDKIESSEMVALEFKPKTILKFIENNGGVSEWHPASFVATIQSLVNHYGVKPVEKIFL